MTDELADHFSKEALPLPLAAAAEGSLLAADVEEEAAVPCPPHEPLLEAAAESSAALVPAAALPSPVQVEA